MRTVAGARIGVLLHHGYRSWTIVGVPPRLAVNNCVVRLRYQFIDQRRRRFAELKVRL